MRKRISVLIMAGGSGERFWPLSTKKHPKQLLKLIDRERSLLQMSVDRVTPLLPLNNIFIATNSIQVEPIREQLPQLPKENIIIEPTFRDTAAAIGFGMVVIEQKVPNSTIIVLPSDHLIEDEELFRVSLEVAVKEAQKGEFIITLGITPTHPETGYGYLKVDSKTKESHITPLGEIEVRDVVGFYEKPTEERAKSYLQEGSYLWNGGMFIFQAEVMREAFKKHLPNHHQLLEEIEKLGDTMRDPNSEELLKLFNSFEKISIDYGVMERLEKIKSLPSNFGWNDVGSYPALTKSMKLNKNNSLVIGVEVIENLSHSNIVIGDSEKPIYLLGVDGLIVVESKEAILICSREEAQNIKTIIPK